MTHKLKGIPPIQFPKDRVSRKSDPGYFLRLESLTFAYSEWNLTAPLFKIPRKTIPNQNITHIFVDFFSFFFSENFENSQLKFKGKSENLEVVKKIT